MMKKRLCTHLSCRWKAWYALRVWPHAKGRGYKTAYIYPISCYQRARR